MNDDTNVTNTKKDDNGSDRQVNIHLNQISVGDVVTFGKYPQTKDGEELPIEWKVLDIRGNRALLLSRYILDVWPYNVNEHPTWWYDTGLIGWLNIDFKDDAFTEAESNLLYEPERSFINLSPAGDIYEEYNAAWKNWQETGSDEPAEAVRSSIFLLSYAEVKKYFPNDRDLFCTGAAAQPTDYVKNEYADRGNTDCWWLRTSSNTSPYAYIVSPVDSIGFSLFKGGRNGVRPALWICLDGQNSEKPETADQTSDGWEKIEIKFLDGIPETKRMQILILITEADNGHALSQARLGNIYFNGDGVEKNYKEAFRWYKAAAENGIAPAQADLADCYLMGYGVPADEQKAVDWLTKAADQGFANAQANLGVWYMEGTHVPKDLEMAELLLRAAVEQKAYNYEFARVNLAKLLLDRPDYSSKQEGLGIIRESGMKNYPPALEMLCRIYEYNWWNIPNIYWNNYGDPGLYYAKKGAEAGNAFCEAVLAGRYADGKGVSRDYNEAFRLARSAAEKNESLGCFMCGFLYENVIRNDKKALEYYEKAVRLGDDASRPDLERVKKKLDLTE